MKARPGGAPWKLALGRTYTKRGIQYSQEAPHGQKRLPNWAVSPGKSAREIHFALQGLSEAVGEAQLHFASLQAELQKKDEAHSAYLATAQKTQRRLEAKLEGKNSENLDLCQQLQQRSDALAAYV